MRIYLRYLIVSGAIVIFSAIVLGYILPSAGPGIWVSAGLAYLVQLLAFGGLVLTGGSSPGWLVAWGSGTLLRLLVIGVTTLLVVRSDLEAVSTLLSLAGFLFVLMILEPVFFRTRMRSR